MRNSAKKIQVNYCLDCYRQFVCVPRHCAETKLQEGIMSESLRLISRRSLLDFLRRKLRSEVVVRSIEVEIVQRFVDRQKLLASESKQTDQTVRPIVMIFSELHFGLLSLLSFHEIFLNSIFFLAAVWVAQNRADF